MGTVTEATTGIGTKYLLVSGALCLRGLSYLIQRMHLLNLATRLHSAGIQMIDLWWFHFPVAGFTRGVVISRIDR